jgi:hypothetical protein
VAFQYFSVKGERGKGKGLNLPFPLCPLTFSQTKREIVRLIRKVLSGILPKEAEHLEIIVAKVIFKFGVSRAVHEHFAASCGITLILNA